MWSQFPYQQDFQKGQKLMEDGTTEVALQSPYLLGTPTRGPVT